MRKGVIIAVALVVIIAVLLGVLLLAPAKKESKEPYLAGPPPEPLTPATTMTITSPAFEHNGMIPRKYTCDGDPPAGGVSPELRIEGVPENAKSLTLIMDDPDAPRGTFVHWVVLNIDPKTTVIKENESPGFDEGLTDFGNAGYGGPCPPSGTHRYFFKLYALDTRLDQLMPKPEALTAPPSKQRVESAMQGHILAQAELIGLYKR